MTTQEVALNREILTTLYANNSIWTRCGGSENRPGTTFDALLILLQQQFPNTMWDENLLNTLLNLGLRTGIFKTRQINIATCAVNVELPPLPTAFYANNAMILERYVNKKYMDIAPRQICNPCCRT